MGLSAGPAIMAASIYIHTAVYSSGRLISDYADARPDDGMGHKGLFIATNVQYKQSRWPAA